jgi:hypothetical protein
MRCDKCKKDFPDHLIAPFVSSEKGVRNCCPICALRLRNTQAGLPIDTPFQGEMANDMWEEATEYVKKGGNK